MVGLLLIVFLVTRCGNNSDSNNDNISIVNQQETEVSLESSDEVDKNEIIVTFNYPELKHLARAELNKKQGIFPPHI